ncbi:hypothetical protein CFI10_00350 [Marinobacterium iners]|uniref:hypothetical protein n=1 Tax=Marinobacterium iners TaxID=48076 RepID=UPI001A8ED423|nr:hypothetical protein [Marinobacterium iners]QSR33466.1 hypothetical protein CFI10_00350 [Marinobacterium iners]
MSDEKSLDDLLGKTPNPLERDAEDSAWLNNDEDQNSSYQTALSKITINSVGLVRAADIDQLPTELRETLWDWMAGQTMPLIDGEPWVYGHDWRRFLRWYSTKTNRKPGRLSGKIHIRDDFDDPI